MLSFVWDFLRLLGKATQSESAEIAICTGLLIAGVIACAFRKWRIGFVLFIIFVFFFAYVLKTVAESDKSTQSENKTSYYQRPHQGEQKLAVDDVDKLMTHA